MGDSVKQSKPEKKFLDLIRFIETEYDCSGMCSPSLFYLVNPVTAGPPKDACLAPFIGDITDLLGNLGGAMIASGVFFLLMIFSVIPMCCLSKVDDQSQVFSSKEGGEIEMNESNDLSNQIPANSIDHIINKAWTLLII